jgi:multiple sugar transport system ATP-binding protein
MALGDRVALMRHGTLEQVGEPQELYERPATLFVASFMGSPPMNLWHVRLIDRNGRLVVASGRQRLALPESVVAEHKGLRSHVGGHLVLGLRPESLVREGLGTAGALLELPVAEVEALGSHVLVHLEAEGAGMQLKDAGWRLGSGERDDADDGGVATFVRPTETLIARLPPHTQVKPGQFLRLGVKLERAHFFDPATQSALR